MMTNTVLIIDKSRSHAEALGTYLERQQYAVTIAGSKTEAQTGLSEMNPDIIIADPYLPEGEIYSVLKEIKQSQPLIQIILFSDPDRLDQVLDAFHSDMLGFLFRPVKRHALDFVLERALDRIRLEKKVIRLESEITGLQNAHELYQQLFDEVPCYITVQDRDFRLTATNKMFQRDFGDEIGDYCFQIYKHRSTPCPQCPVTATFEDGKPRSTEEIVTSKTGEQYNVIAWTAPIRNRKGEIDQVMEMSTNITQIRQLQDHLTSLGLMLGSMSHGVRGMLTALDGGIYQLETGLARQDSKRIEHAFDQVKEMTERIKKMILGILYYAKSRELNYQTVDAEKFCRDIADTVKPKAEKNNVRLDISIASALGMIDVDTNWFQSAIVNILENAIDACSIDHEKSEHDVKFKVFLADGDHINFIIEDNGIGMDQETKEKLFTLFFSSKGSRGTGLGLFIAHQVISQHGGTIQVSSRPHEGSTFEIILPLRPDD